MAKILVTDDDSILREVIKDVLINAGHTVLTATDGYEAMDILSIGEIDLLILDIIMPEKEGLETLRDIHLKGVKCKVIAITGKTYTTGYDTLFAAEAFGAHMTLRKPFHNQELLDAVNKQLAES
jgi:DNA-binding response OmpR family regulator